MTDPVLIATVRKSDAAQIRVHRQVWHGRRVIDIRVFWQKRDSSDWARSGRGITFDEQLLPAVLNGLQAAQDSINQDKP